MRMSRQAVAAATGCMVLATGCVSLDEHRQLQMAQKRALAEKAQLEQELYDVRTNAENLRSQLQMIESRLSNRDAMVSNLQSENEELQSLFSSAQKTAEQLAQRKVVNDPIIIETKLPAELDTALRDFASQYPDSVTYDAKRGIVKWKSDLVFALGSDVVKDSARESLRGFAEVINTPAGSGFDVLIVGHTDDRPVSRPATRQAHPTNWHLSAHRAISVSKVMRDYGIPPTRIGVMGFGEYRPIASNATEAGRAQNRRVEIYVVPAGSIGGVQMAMTGEPSTRKVDVFEENIK